MLQATARLSSAKVGKVFELAKIYVFFRYSDCILLTTVYRSTTAYVHLLFVLRQ